MLLLLLRQRERRVKRREKVVSQREHQIRKESYIVSQLNHQWQYRVLRLKRYGKILLSFNNSLQQRKTDLQKLSDSLNNLQSKLDDKKNLLNKINEDLDDQQRYLNNYEHCLHLTMENFTRRERAIRQQEEDIITSHDELRRSWICYQFEKIKLRKLNCLLSREIQHIISLESQENRPMVKVPPRKEHVIISKTVLSANSSAPETVSSVNQFRIKLIECLNDENVSTQDLENKLITVAERNRVREEERILRNRTLREQFAYIWRDTSIFMRRVFEYYPITSDEYVQYISDCEESDNGSPCSTSSQFTAQRDIRDKCYADSFYKFINCNERAQIASPFCLYNENYGLSASTTATHNCIESHMNDRLFNEIYEDKNLAENSVSLRANVVKPLAEAKNEIFARMDLSDSSDESDEDSSFDNEVFEANNHRRFRLGHQWERYMSMTRRIFTAIPMLFKQREVCSRDSFDVRRRMNRSYNPFAWMYSNDNTSVTEQLCGIHLNLGEDMQPIVTAVLQYQRYKSIISEDCMDELLHSPIIQLCGSAIMFSLLTTLRFDSISVHTVENYLIKILHCYADEANYDKNLINPLSNTENNKLNVSRANVSILLMNKWRTNLPNFIGERTGNIWMMFDNVQFFDTLWWNLSETIPHVRTHVASNDNNHRFYYRVHSTMSMVCLVMARLGRIIGIWDCNLSDFLFAEFGRLMNNGCICLAVPFSFFCAKNVVREEIQKVLRHIEPSAIDFKINMYAIAYMLRVRNIADTELSQEWSIYRNNSNINKADLQTRDIVERDIVAVRDRAFILHHDNNTCNTHNNNNTDSYINCNISNKPSAVISLTALSIRSIVINSGITFVRMYFNDLFTPTDNTLMIVRYFTDCMWHFVSELPVPIYAKNQRCYKDNNCPRSYIHSYIYRGNCDVTENNSS